MKYKVLKETPFHDVGDVITGYTFRLFYCRERVEPTKFTEEKQKKFFQPIRYTELPLDFIWDGLIYSKKMDGHYHTCKSADVWLDGTPSVYIKSGETGTSYDEQTLLYNINNSTLPVYEIKRLES